MTTSVPPPTIKDYLTGNDIPDVGAESHRQALVRYLVETKGYQRASLWMDAPLRIDIAGTLYRSKIDLIVNAGSPAAPFMAVKCCAGSLGSREREILAAARIFQSTPIPLAVVSDGRDAIVLDTLAGRPTAHGLEALPSAKEAERLLAGWDPQPYPEERLARAKLIFRTYDQDNINVIRPVGPSENQN
jgi:hypothetical protein